MTAKELSQYLKVNEKKIYQLARSGEIPHVWIGGKIVFPKEIIDRWILENTERGRHNFIAGSDDLLLRRVIDIYNKSGDSIVFYAPVGSMNGLKALKEGAVQISCVHILDVSTRTYSLSYLDRYLDRKKYIAIHLFEREQGFICPKNNPNEIRSFRDVAEQKLLFTNRNLGSGTRLLIDFLLQEEHVNTSRIRGYDEEVQSHLQAGIRILQQEADCAFGIRYVAHILGLEFVPIHREEFHMVVPEEHYASQSVREFADCFTQSFFINYVGDYTGYDISRIGQLLTPP